ncbi:hypothetical protein [Acetobacter sp. UBA5411]|uniref:hypothetical protein n=1 Tax=Acetobacter sp. UBA5411 TaxID=1945905 RepID=UPI0025C33785|nr:hypothetical protein [Acetobacter sp. UBA5411]
MDYDEQLDNNRFWLNLWRMICVGVVALAITISTAVDVATTHDDAVVKAAIEHGYGPAEARCAVMDRAHSCVQTVKIVEKTEDDYYFNKRK